MKKFFVIILCYLLAGGLWVLSCNGDENKPETDQCETDPQPGCPNYVEPDPCETDPQPDCPNYIDPCETDPQPGCPNYVEPDPCETDPQPDCPNYIDPCETNPQPDCPGYVDPETPILGSSITIGAQNYTLDKKEIEKVDDGIWYMRVQLTNQSKPLIIHTVRYSTSNTGYSIETWIGRDSISGKETPSTMVERYEQNGRQVRVAINGGFYGTAVGGTPITMELMNGVMTFPPVGNYPMIAFDDENRPYLDSVKMISKVVKDADKSECIINSINGTRWTDELVLYNSYKGKRTGTNEWGIEALCYPTAANWERLNSHVNVRCRVEKISTAGNMEIPKGYIVLSGHGTANQYISTLKTGDYVNVTVDYALKSFPKISTANIRNVVSGWNIILNENEIMDYFNNADGLESLNHPRTGVGYSADEAYVYFTVVEGRNPTQANPTISAGVSTKELAQVMQYFGAAHAINLDGGGSTCLVIDKETMNFCSDGSQRAVADGLAIIKR